MKDYDDVKFRVNKREHEVDVEKLKILLISHKKRSKMTNSDIALKMNLPKTLIEHWFRKDKYFSVPDKTVWFELKELLRIETDEFDESITQWIEQDGKYDMGNRVYKTEGICPTIEANSNIKIYVKRDH